MSGTEEGNARAAYMCPRLLGNGREVARRDWTLESGGTRRSFTKRRPTSHPPLAYLHANDVGGSMGTAPTSISSGGTRQEEKLRGF